MRCESSVIVGRLPAEVFPWLLDADKVPRWTTGLEVYEPLDPGPLRVGSRIRQLRVTELDAPSRALLRFEGSGFKAANEYACAETGSGSRVTWVISGDTTSFKAKLIAPMVQAKLQEKMETDLARLRALLAGETAAA